MLNSNEEKEPEELPCLESTNAGITIYDDVPHDRKNFQTKMCNYFFKYGYCKFGSSCRYRHFRKKTENNSGQYNSNQASVPKKRFEKKEFYSENSLICSGVKESNRALSRQICRYYKAGNCSKDKCDFLHIDNFYAADTTFISSTQNSNISRKFYSAGSRMAKKKSTPLCYYFKKGLCTKGDNCKYFHHNKSTELKCENSSNLAVENGDNVSDLCHMFRNSLSDSTKTDAPICLKENINVSNLLTKENTSSLRTIEINQLKKRFPNHETVVENKTFSVIFQPSDPDWPFDVRKLKVEADFPENYPLEKCKLTVHQNGENIPELLIIHLNKAIFDWIESKYEGNTASSKTELIFRPFLKWFDKNLEELFIAGLRKVKTDLKAKEDGIEFVPAENLFSSSRKNASSESSDESSLDRDSLDVNQSYQMQTTAFDPNTSSDQNNKLPHYSGNQGTKLIFSDLELIEGAVAIICTKISVTLQCCRCKTSFSMKAVPKNNNGHICSKCSKNLGFTFDPSTVHQFSSVLGNLYLLDCVAVDVNLVECHFLVDCFNCSKQVPVDGIHYGQKHKMWCTFCHEKMLISVGSVKFQAVALTSVPATKYLPVKKIDKKVKDPVVKEGEPLPNFGACKHYKKSFRWLRFPCCGRLYPCDECHNEKETDHEMKYASRMVCGFCAKEQPYSREKPCLLCTQSLTKKSGSHWEGGKGCRNKIQMSRDDKQKYAGVSKTVSKKAQNTKPKKKH